MKALPSNQKGSRVICIDICNSHLNFVSLNYQCECHNYIVGGGRFLFPPKYKLLCITLVSLRPKVVLLEKNFSLKNLNKCMCIRNFTFCTV